jgi:hypothetical protein
MLFVGRLLAAVSSEPRFGDECVCIMHLYEPAERLTYGSPKFVMARLDRATSSNTMLREVARSSRAMTCWGRVNVNADRYYTSPTER